jgi:hypothetical protein
VQQIVKRCRHWRERPNPDSFGGRQFGLGIAEGLLKLGMNAYRGWVSENAVRWLRTLSASLPALVGCPAGEGH